MANLRQEISRTTRDLLLLNLEDELLRKKHISEGGQDNVEVTKVRVTRDAGDTARITVETKGHGTHYFTVRVTPHQ